MKSIIYLSLMLITLNLYSYESKSYFDDSDTTATMEENNFIYNHPGRINVENKYDFFGEASFLYWQAKTDYMTLGENNQTVNRINHRDSVLLDFKYKPGFKVALGMSFPANDWQLFLDYQRITPHASNEASTAGNFVQYWFVTGDASIFTIKGQWKLDYNMFDLFLRKPFYISKNFIIRPAAGLTTGWIDQKLDIALLSAARPLTTVQAKTDSWVFGPIVQFKMDYLLGKYLKFFGNIEGSIFYQKFTKIALDDVNPLDPSFREKHFRNNNYSRITPYSSFVIGASWGTYFSDSCNHFDISFAYETKYYWNQNMIRNIISQNYNEITPVATGFEAIGHLMLHGFTMTARLDF